MSVLIKLERGWCTWQFFFRFCTIWKIARKEFEAEIVLNLFLISGKFEAQCSYKIVLIKRKACICVYVFHRRLVIVWLGARLSEWFITMDMFFMTSCDNSLNGRPVIIMDVLSIDLIVVIRIGRWWIYVCLRFEAIERRECWYFAVDLHRDSKYCAFL